MAHQPLTGVTSFPSTTVSGYDNAIKLLESLQNDFKSLSMETKKKYPQIKEASEEAIVKLRNAAAVAADNLQQQKQLQHNHHQIYYVVNQILYPVVQGCETKEPKIVKMCLGTIQKLITHRAVDQKGARYITDTLWMLMESGTEHVKVLQSVTLLLTTDCIVRGETLARNLVLCFRLHFTKDSQAVINTAGATVRQLVALVFERVLHEDEQLKLHLKTRNNDVNKEFNKQNGANDQQQIIKTQSLQLHYKTNNCDMNNITSLAPCASDAYLMFQDLVRLVNTDRPFWLIGITEMTRTFGLELMESLLSDFQPVFYKHPEFGFLLKERVCALVIKLFSPNVKNQTGSNINGRKNSFSTNNNATVINATNCPNSNHRCDDRPHYAITIRLLRLVSILVRKYHKLLVTECEIFLSLIVKFLDADKPTWQRSVALEILHRLVVEPGLLVEFCACYDLKLHSTKIFRDIIDSLACYVQTLFNPAMAGNNSINNATVIAATTNAVLQGQSLGGPGISPQSGFLGRGGVWLPLEIQLPTGQAKSVYLEINDKQEEPPQITDGYGMSVAYACLVDTVRAIQIEVHPDIHQSVVHHTTTISKSDNDPHECQQNIGEQNVTKNESANDNYSQQVTEVKTSLLHEQIIKSSWCGLLTAFCPLIESCTDESITENMLKAMQVYISLCGLLDMQEPRDAFITIMCRLCLPLYYNLSVLNGTVNTQQQATVFEDHRNQQYSYSSESPEYKQQQVVVAVGSPLATPSSALQTLSSSGTPVLNNGPVMLTNKNLQSMRALLVLAHCNGSILGLSWHLVLTTLQHLVWILGLKPSTCCFKATSATIDNTVSTTTSSSSNIGVITTAMMAVDLPVLSTMLGRLFESSRYLDDTALHHLIDALCKLSHEAMELASSNQEPSLFAVAKLLETGLVNLSRVDIFWRPITNHMLDICQHPHIRMRQWGVEALTYLVKTALQYKYQPILKDNQKLQTLLLSPLSQLSFNIHGDVRQRQLECVLQVLHNSGETLSHGWPLVLNIMGAVSDRHGENLIKIAFQCLQLVVTDFLPLMPTKSLPLCLKTTAKFGIQTRELNISLTAIGLMWNIADYFKQNKDKLLCNRNTQHHTSGEEIDAEAVAGAGVTDQQELVYPDFPGVTTLAEMSEFDKLWMCLFTKLGELCIDPRPAVRKSAGQTLFATISAHANLLSPLSWNAVLWQILFPLMNKVQVLCESASDSTCNIVASADYTNNRNIGNSGTILIHHSRDTDQKQWAETQVSTLYGLARVFNTEKYSMTISGDFVKAWTLLLEYMENAALNKNTEVSMAGLRSLHELLIVYSNNGVSDINTAKTIIMQNDNNSREIEHIEEAENWESKKYVDSQSTQTTMDKSSTEDEIWACTWNVWMRIGSAATMTAVVKNSANLSSQQIPGVSSSSTTSDHHELTSQQKQHKQQFLTTLLQIFPMIFTNFKTKFTDKDLNDLFHVLDVAAAVDESTASMLSDNHFHYHHYNQQQKEQSCYSQQLTPLHDEILQCLGTIERETLLFDVNESSGSTKIVDNNVAPFRDYSTKCNTTLSEKQQQQYQELIQRFLCPLFDQLLKFCHYVCPPLQTVSNDVNNTVTNNSSNRQQITMANDGVIIGHSHNHNKLVIDSNYIAFGEKAVLMLVDLYSMTATEMCVVKGEILRRIIEVFSAPLASRYSNYPTSSSYHYHLDFTNSSGNLMPQQHQMLIRQRYQQQQNTWKLLVVGLMNVLSVGIPLAREHQGDDYNSIWSPLGSVLEDILFPKNTPPTCGMVKNNKIVNDNDENESVIIDCQLVEFLKVEILSQSINVPREFIMRIVVLLNRGSVLSTSSSTMSNYPYGSDGYDTILDCCDRNTLGTGAGGQSLLREQFAKVCFETLLQFSLVDGISSSSSSLPQPTETSSTNNNGSYDSTTDSELVTGKLAVTALLHRFQEVVEKFCHDQNLTGKCPLPRYRTSEISFVLKAIATLIVSLKKTPDKVNNAVWNQLVRLYPSLVHCIPYIQQCCSSSQVTDSLTEALLQYGDLLLKMPPLSTTDAQL